MRKTFKAIALIIGILLGIPTAAAYQEAAEAKALILGEVYHIDAFQTIDATIELPAGTVVQTGAPEIELFSDAAHTKALSREFGSYGQLKYDDSGATINAQIYSYTISQAGTYYAYIPGMILDSTYFRFTDPSSVDIELLQAVPASGSTVNSGVNSSGSGEVSLFFNTPVAFTKAYLKIGDKQMPEISGSDPSSVVNVKIGPSMREAYRTGLLSADGGTRFSVIIEGLANAAGKKYGADGRIELNYTATRKALELVSTNIVEGRQFLSYYPKGNSDAILTLTFDGPVSTDEGYKPYASFGIGEIEYSGKYYYEEIVPTINGNTLTFDLSGVNRRPAIAAAGVADGELYSFKVCNVFDTTHQPAQGLTESNVGSYPFTFIYKVVEEQTIDADFVPATGADLAGYTKLSIWHNNAQVIESFDGVLFAYDDGDSQLIPRSELKNISTEPGEVEYNVTIPEKARTAPVTVSLANIVSFDGYDKSIQASYNKFVVTYCTPFAEGATMLEIPHDPWMADESSDPADKLIHIRTNYSQKYPEMMVYFEVEDVTANMVLRSSEMDRLDDGQYVGAWFAEATTLTAGHVYEARFKAWPTRDDYYYNNSTKLLGTFVVTFFGAGEGFAYSPVQFVSIDPDPAMGPITPEQNSFTITYDGLVKIREDLTGYSLGMGAGAASVEIESVDADPENGGFSSIWRLTVDKYGMTAGTGLDLHVAAYDQNGAPVMGDMMTYTDQDYKSFSYQIYDNSGYLPLTSDPADGAKVGEISTIKLTCEKSIGFNWNCPEPIVIYSMTGIAHTVVRSDKESSEVKILKYNDTVEETYAEIRLEQPITDEGSYMISIPEGYFMLGSQFDTSYNLATEINLTIGGASTGIPMVVDPTNGEVLQSISKIVVSTPATIYSDCPDFYMALEMPEYMSVVWTYYDYSTDDPSIKVLHDGEGQNAPVIGYEFYLGSTYSVPGTYTLTIPEKFFELNGQFNNALTLTYTVGDPATFDFKFIPQQGQLVDEVKEIVVRIPGAVLNPGCTDEATLNNPASFMIFEPLETWTTQEGFILWGEGAFTFKFAHAESYHVGGEYTFFIPENFFVRGDAYNPPTYLTFQVKGGQVKAIDIEVTAYPDNGDTCIEIIDLCSTTGLIPSYGTEEYVRMVNTDTNETVREVGPIFFTRYCPWPDEGCYVNSIMSFISFDPILNRADASYRLIIPANFFTDENLTRNEEIVVDYPKTPGNGIADITADADGHFAVYDIQGRLVLDTDRADCVAELPAGFYIVNGRKVFLH